MVPGPYGICVAATRPGVSGYTPGLLHLERRQITVGVIVLYVPDVPGQRCVKPPKGGVYPLSLGPLGDTAVTAATKLHD